MVLIRLHGFAADLQTGRHLKVCCSQIAKTGFLVKYLSQSFMPYSKNSHGLKYF